MARRKKKLKSRANPAEAAKKKEQRQFRSIIKSVFETAGFKEVPTRDTEFEFMGKRGEFDSIFVHENIVVVVEDTCASTETARNHLLRKHVLYDTILANQDQFIPFLRRTFLDFERLVATGADPVDFKLIIAYCCKYRLEDTHKAHFEKITFIDNRHLQYFSALAKTLGGSMRYELFKFFELSIEDIGFSTGNLSGKYEGFILPESPSGFPSGYKVVTFYVDPETLITLAYVLRKDSWRDVDSLYQRMISKNKIGSMRKYLAQDERVFINNIIVSLPSDTKILNPVTKAQLDPKEVNKTTPITVEVPIRFNSVGVIDGQHRVFAYHEGSDNFESTIAIKRKKQHLLVTGVVYPASVSESQQSEFEARLFLEINDKQTKTKAELRHSIEAIVNPFSVIAISRSVINRLASNGPLCGFLEEHQFDKGKLKSSSLVSYGIRHIVKGEGSDTLINLWKNPHKELLISAVNAATAGQRKFDRPDHAVLESYLNFCAEHINSVLVGYKLAVPREMWTLDRRVSRALSATAINGVVHALRRLLEEGKTTNMEGYKTAFKSLKLDFSPKKFKYKSSHWRDLGNKIVNDCF